MNTHEIVKKYIPNYHKNINLAKAIANLNKADQDKLAQELVDQDSGGIEIFDSPKGDYSFKRDFDKMLIPAYKTMLNQEIKVLPATEVYDLYFKVANRLRIKGLSLSTAVEQTVLYFGGQFLACNVDKVVNKIMKKEKGVTFNKN